MKPLTETVITQIAAPIEKVFAALTDPLRIATWLPSCTEALAEGPLKRGALLKVRFSPTRLVTFEIVDFKAPVTFGWVERDGRAGAKTFFRLDPADGAAATAVTVREQWQVAGVMAWLKARFLDKRHRVKLGRAMEALRVSVGAGTPATQS